MTDTQAAPTDPFAHDALNAVEGLDPVDPAYAHVVRITTALNLIPLAIGASVADWLVMPQIGGPYGLLTTAAWLFAILGVVTLPARRVARWGYRIGEGQLRVARGWLFRTDTIVPFVRVQHIDVGQGPVERMFGLSHLVVHTSGTHNSTVTLPGLHSDLAAAMRETIRRHIQTDFA
ncbi:PH domain-containing protein [Sphingopyxis sp. BSN-002]|uniref:PH domain-containing protein n=1 Tax=Sphingopyxis sp. BSN-002 TaxID=2911495 RepID=UPI001EDB48D6|nr:PH domain-containing protein [Sphingopyxis sp. BSN-002]UKK82853.1 PH domain-containing protein [Sphingopyxis sp. BSN-002]